MTVARALSAIIERKALRLFTHFWFRRDIILRCSHIVVNYQHYAARYASRRPVSAYTPAYQREYGPVTVYRRGIAYRGYFLAAIEAMAQFMRTSVISMNGDGLPEDYA